jgi:hypothetical protein
VTIAALKRIANERPLRRSERAQRRGLVALREAIIVDEPHAKIRSLCRAADRLTRQALPLDVLFPIDAPVGMILEVTPVSIHSLAWRMAVTGEQSLLMATWQEKRRPLYVAYRAVGRFRAHIEATIDGRHREKTTAALLARDEDRLFAAAQHAVRAAWPRGLPASATWGVARHG